MSYRLDLITHNHAGLSLVELMVAITISSFLMLGLTATFKNSSDTYRALERSSALIENGRYATSLLYEDLRHSGYLGHFFDLGDPPGALPDPCETGSLANLSNAMSVPIQTYTAPDLVTRAAITSIPASTCNTSLLANNNLKPGSDVLVVRRADTSVYTGSPVTNDIYIQANSRAVNLLLGNSIANVPVDSADGVTPNLRKFPSKLGNTVIADTRKYRVHVYFVAPCSLGSGANEVCTVSDDTLPTLKRLELSSDGTNTIMDVVPLVEGIEYIKLEYGIDNSPNSVNPVTGLQGDGIPDFYISSPSAAQMSQVVSIKMHLLARSPERTANFTDTKQFVLAGINVPASNDEFKRHVFSTEVRLMNMSGRREIPE
jgi:type IV pilus assembly protein PilW